MLPGFTNIHQNQAPHWTRLPGTHAVFPGYFLLGLN
jgi:hypothetical protein